MYLSKNWYNILLKRRVIQFLLKKKNILDNSIYFKKDIQKRLITKFKFNKIIKKKKFNKNFLESKSFKNIINCKNEYIYDNKKKYTNGNFFVNLKKSIKYCGLYFFKNNKITKDYSCVNANSVYSKSITTKNYSEDKIFLLIYFI